jgi:hypothetical protein
MKPRPSRRAWIALTLALASLAVLAAAELFMSWGGLPRLAPAPVDVRIDYLLKLQAARAFPSRVSAIALGIAATSIFAAVTALTEQRRWPRRPNTNLAIVSLALSLLSLPGAWLLGLHNYLITMSWPGGE